MRELVTRELESDSSRLGSLRAREHVSLRARERDGAVAQINSGVRLDRGARLNSAAQHGTCTARRQHLGAWRQLWHGSTAACGVAAAVRGSTTAARGSNGTRLGDGSTQLSSAGARRCAPWRRRAVRQQRAARQCRAARQRRTAWRWLGTTAEAHGAGGGAAQRNLLGQDLVKNHTALVWASGAAQRNLHGQDLVKNPHSVGMGNKFHKQKSIEKPTQRPMAKI